MTNTVSGQSAPYLFVLAISSHLTRPAHHVNASSGAEFENFYRGSHMSAHVLLNLLNELGKRDQMRGLPSILSLFRNEFNKFNNTRARMLDSTYHMFENSFLSSKQYNFVIMYATLL